MSSRFEGLDESQRKAQIKEEATTIENAVRCILNRSYIDSNKQIFWAGWDRINENNPQIDNETILKILKQIEKEDEKRSEKKWIKSAGDLILKNYLEQSKILKLAFIEIKMTFNCSIASFKAYEENQKITGIPYTLIVKEWSEKSNNNFSYCDLNTLRQRGLGPFPKTLASTGDEGYVLIRDCFKVSNGTNHKFKFARLEV